MDYSFDEILPNGDHPDMVVLRYRTKNQGVIEVGYDGDSIIQFVSQTNIDYLNNTDRTNIEALAIIMWRMICDERVKSVRAKRNLC